MFPAGDDVAMGGGIVSNGGNSAGTGAAASTTGSSGGWGGGGVADETSTPAFLFGKSESGTEVSGMRGRTSVVGVFLPLTGGGSSFGILPALAPAAACLFRWVVVTCWLDSSSESKAGDDDRSTSTFCSLALEKLVVSVFPVYGVQFSILIWSCERITYL